MRGVMPPGALLTSGTMRVSLSPTLRRKRLAVISPMTMPDSPGFSSSRSPCTMCLPMMETLVSCWGSMPLICTGCIMPLNESMPSSSAKGTAPTTSGCFMAASATRRQSSRGCSALRVAWETMPRMRELISFWKPFMTESTTIMASTPRARPSIEVSEMKEM
ncbi:hypothetical protein D3C81_1772060 [compost metagenome]